MRLQPRDSKGTPILARTSSSTAAVSARGHEPLVSAGGGGILSLSQDWSPDLQKSRVYEQILLDIILGELAPNARLEEQALVRRYGVGLAGVRDALSRLALEGLGVRRARSGTTVSALDLVELSHALEVRSLLEPYCAAQAAANATAEDIAQIVQAFDDGDAAVRARDSRALVAMDQRFHAALAKASRNLTLARILVPLQHKAARYWVYSMSADTEEERFAEVERHRVLAARIAERDADGARLAAMRILKIFPEVTRRPGR